MLQCQDSLKSMFIETPIDIAVESRSCKIMATGSTALQIVIDSRNSWFFLLHDS